MAAAGVRVVDRCAGDVVELLEDRVELRLGRASYSITPCRKASLSCSGIRSDAVESEAIGAGQDLRRAP